MVDNTDKPVIHYRVRYTRHDRPGEIITIPRITAIPQLAAKMMIEQRKRPTSKQVWVEMRERRPWVAVTDSRFGAGETEDWRVSPAPQAHPATSNTERRQASGEAEK